MFVLTFLIPSWKCTFTLLVRPGKNYTTLFVTKVLCIRHNYFYTKKRKTRLLTLFLYNSVYIIDSINFID